MSGHITPPNSAPIHECARWMSLDYPWLYGLVRSGTIPAENRGSERRAKWWVRPADVAAHLDSLRKRP